MSVPLMGLLKVGIEILRTWTKEPDLSDYWNCSVIDAATELIFIDWI